MPEKRITFPTLTETEAQRRVKLITDIFSGNILALLSGTALSSADRTIVESILRAYRHKVIGNKIPFLQQANYRQCWKVIFPFEPLDPSEENTKP